MNVIPKLTHIALRVSSIDQSVKFYETYACLKLISMREEKEGRVAWLGNPKVKEQFIIVLLEFPFQGSEQPRFDHIGLDVPSRNYVDEINQKAKDEGILFMEAKDHGNITGYFCIVKDPDGNLVEFSHGQKIDEALQ
jgi:catechol 2,3-dioxygenase-like lactoylglutathione lyase family enzyme